MYRGVAMENSPDVENILDLRRLGIAVCEDVLVLGSQVEAVGDEFLSSLQVEIVCLEISQ
jgi:hypothetical protein